MPFGITNAAATFHHRRQYLKPIRFWLDFFGDILNGLPSEQQGVEQMNMQAVATETGN